MEEEPSEDLSGGVLEEEDEVDENIEDMEEILCSGTA